VLATISANDSGYMQYSNFLPVSGSLILFDKSKEELPVAMT